MEEVIQAYMKDVDEGLLLENLKLTPQQRMDKFTRFMESVMELRAAGERMRARQATERESVAA